MIAMFLATALASPPADLHKQTVVAAPVPEVWTAFTTSEGAQTFFAPAARIRLEMGGPYELFFDPSAPEGERGSEGMRILAYLPQEMLAFEWNAPPKFPEIRDAGRRTFVVVQLRDAGGGRTRVRLHHLGWGDGGRWREVRDYFDKAWDHVLRSLVRRFQAGPIDWARKG
jgi:uncharacterized protein YndB with AHSA1/START domain